MTDHLVDDLRRLAAAPVPVTLDHAALARAGRRRVVRRRQCAAAATGVLVVATAAGAAGLAGLTGSTVATDDRGLDVATSAPPVPASTAAPLVNTSETDGQLRGLVRDALAGTSATVGGGGDGGDGRHGIERYDEVNDGGQVGYVGMLVRPATSAELTDLCDTPIHPRLASERTCAVDSDADGTWAVLGWADSLQGQVLAVRVTDGQQAVTVATSDGFPAFDPDVDTVDSTADELPWGGWSTDRRGNLVPVDPPLDGLPLTVEQVVELARSVLAVTQSIE